MRFPSVPKTLDALLPMGLGIAPAEAALPAESLLTPDDR